EEGIGGWSVTGVQTCALPIYSLIAMGLQLISDSYLDVMGRKAEEAGLAFDRKMVDGKHYKALIEDAQASGYDLVVMGALGMGAEIGRASCRERVWSWEGRGAA